jgi:hypothetical protein
MRYLRPVVAIPLIGFSFWGGRTFVRDTGSTWLDNHASQRRLALVESPTGLRETLEWRGEDVAHGPTSPWLAISGVDSGGRSASVVLAQPGPVLPWFVRAGEYLGAGPALAWERPCDVPAGGTIACALDPLVRDGPIEGAEHAAGLAASLG